MQIKTDDLSSAADKSNDLQKALNSMRESYATTSPKAFGRKMTTPAN